MSEEGIEYLALPEITSPTLATTFLAEEGGEEGRLAASTLAALLSSTGAVAPGPVTAPDVTALATSQTLPAPAPTVSSGLTGGSLTSSSSPLYPGGSALLLAAASSTPYGVGVWWRDGSIPLDEIDYIEAYIGVVAPTLGDECYAGIVWCGDATVGTVIVCTVGIDSSGTAAMLLSRGDAPGGALLAAEAPTVAAGWLRIKVLGSRPVTADPPALIFQYEFTSTDGTQARGTLTTSEIEGLASWSAAWDTAACNRVGLVLQAGNGAANPIAALASGFRVVRKAAP